MTSYKLIVGITPKLHLR